MSTSTTTNLGLVLDNADEPVKTHHRHANENLATLDVTIKSLQDSMGNAKALLGQLGIDAEDHYVVDAETARTTLGVPSSSDIADIVRQNVPLMSPTTLGGAKLEEHGGLVLRDEKLGIGSLVQESNGIVSGGIAELTAKGHAEQDGTPTPESPVEIQVVRGRNLLDADTVYASYKQSDGSFIAAAGYINAITTAISADMVGKEMTFSALIDLTGAGNHPTYIVVLATVGGTKVNGNEIWDGNKGLSKVTFTPTSTSDTVKITFGSEGSYNVKFSEVQLELGSTPTPYVPYGHVGMEVRDPDTDELISCTALPLPSRGWVGSLPDGTADVLTLDGAGKVEWELGTEEMALAIRDMNNNENYPGWTNSGVTPIVGYDINGTLSNIYLNIGENISINTTNHNTSGIMFFTQQTYGLTQSQWMSRYPDLVCHVYLPLATPIIEECGYVQDWPTDIPEGATISIPELDALGVKYFVDDSAGTLARQWYERANSEYADRITALEQAVAELATS